MRSTLFHLLNLNDVRFIYVLEYVDSSDIVVGHGFSQDVKWLQSLGVTMPPPPPVRGQGSMVGHRFRVDTQTITVAKTNNPKNVRGCSHTNVKS